MATRWSDHFVIVSRRKRGEYNSKTTPAEEVTWEGYFEGHLICAVSTVRLVNGNMAHFCVSSNARIGENLWNLRGGHFVDLRVIARPPLTDDEWHLLRS